MRWLTVSDDDLELVDKTTEFLQAEFCPKMADDMWSAEYFKWKLGPANPAGRGYISLAKIDGEVVGTVTLTKKRLLIDGIECVGGEVGDSYSSANVRRRSQPESLSKIDSNPKSYVNRSIFGRLASDVRERAEGDGVKIIYGTPNKNAYPGWTKRLDYFDLSNYRNIPFFRPTTNYLLRRFPFLTFIKHVLKSLEFLFIVVHKTFFTQIWQRNLRCTVLIPTAVDLNGLWLRNKPIVGFSLVRDSSYWRHRYLEHPIAKYTFFSIVNNGVFSGVVVTRLHYTDSGKCYVSIMEWLVDEDTSFDFILTHILWHYRKSGVEMFNLWAEGLSKEARASKRGLFLSRERKPIIISNSESGKQLLDMSSDIKFYLGSSDAV